MPDSISRFFSPLAPVLLLACFGCSDSPETEQDAAFTDATVADANAPDANVPSTCDYSCVLDILPRKSQVPLAASGTHPSLALVGVHDEGMGELPTLLYEDATWRSLDSSVATVDNTGIVTPVARGKTWIEVEHLGLAAYAEVSVSGEVLDKTLGPGPLARSYRLFVPDSYEGASTPLVFSFHGGFGTGANQMDMSQMNRAAAEHGFLVAYPNGTGAIKTWNGGACCGSAADNGVDDVAFVREVLTTLQRDYTIDPKQVYASGFSNGAILSHRLACEASDIIAAIAPVGGGLNLGGDFLVCEPDMPVPVLTIHGANDRNYPYEGGVGLGFSNVDFYSIAETISDWVATNGADSDTSHGVFQNNGVICLEHRGPTTRSDVRFCRVHELVGPVADDDIVYDGGGHAFPGGARGPSATSDLPSSFLDGAETIWQFFAEHPKP